MCGGGEVLHIHRKVYLATYGAYEENKYFARGMRVDVIPYRGFRLALLICYDFWHPSVVYLAACSDADVFLVIANSPIEAEDTNRHLWDLLTRSTAVTYGGYVMFSNRVGMENGWSFWGGSSVVDPLGRVLAGAGAHEEILYATLDRSTIWRAREALPIIRDNDSYLTIRELQRIVTKREVEKSY